MSHREVASRALEISRRHKPVIPSEAKDLLFSSVGTIADTTSSGMN